MEKRIIYILTFLLFVFINNHSCFAQTTVTISDGQLSFETYDTKATSGIKWKTVGFNVTMKKCLGNTGNGGYPAKYQHATIMLSDGDISSIDLENGKLKNTFVFSESKLTKALIDAGFAPVLNDGGTVYLNGIFQVVKDGRDYGEKHENLNSIKYAMPWRNPNDFNDRFDIPVTYNAAKQKIVVKYITENNITIKTETLDKKLWKKPGESFKVTLDNSVKYKNKDYTLQASYFSYINEELQQRLYKSLEYGYSISEVKNVSSRMVLGGVTVYAVMVNENEEVDVKEEENTISFTNENLLRNYCRILAEEYGNEAYYVKKAIPSGEEVYCKTIADPYLYKGELLHYFGNKKYKVKVKKKYILKWKEAKIGVNGRVTYDNKSRIVNLEKDIVVTRDFDFWKVNSVAAYYLESVVLKNNALISTQSQLNNNNMLETVFNRFKSHYLEPDFNSVVELPTETIDGGKEEPSDPTMDFRSVAEKNVGKIKVKNDELTIGGKEIMTSTWCYESTKKPVIPKMNSIKRIQLLNRNILIPSSKPNNSYSSTCDTIYKKVYSYNMEQEYDDEKITKQIIDVNGINVYTPVVCDGQVENKISLCQLCNMDATKVQLVLDTKFMIKVSNTGSHINEKGYYYKNYKKYVDKNYVKFPFDIYIDNKYYGKNTWISITSDVVECYLPIWVEEGAYSISFKSIALNHNQTIDLKLRKDFNDSSDSYGAYDTVDVVVSGRMFGLNVYDISDYPLWESVFRKSDGNLSGVNYTAGTKDLNGIDTNRRNMFTLPLINGSHPYFTNKGALKRGYLIRMSINTIGKLSDKSDRISIYPRFYFVDNKGNRTEVDVFYRMDIKDGNDTYNSKMVKVGSFSDIKNIKKCSLGNPLWGIDDDKLNKTALQKGIPYENYKNNVINTYTFGNIDIKSDLQVFEGRDYLNQKKLYLHDVSEDLINSRVQKWYFEYYLPADIRVAVKGTVTEDTKVYDFSSSNWLNRGWLMLNFNIVTVDDGQLGLDYRNYYNNIIYGACNMWSVEGMTNKKTDYQGNQFNIEYGDIALFYLNKSVSSDYVSGGTH